MTDAPRHYSLTAIRLHWLMAILMISLFGLGLYMTGLKLSPQKLQLYSWHKWAGVTVFLLAVARIACRIGHKPPADPAGMPRWQVVAAHGVLDALTALVESFDQIRRSYRVVFDDEDAHACSKLAGNGRQER